jgi:hypothetical protein
LASVIPEIEAQFGAKLTRIVADRGCRGTMPQVVLNPGGLQPLVRRRMSACPFEQRPAAFSPQRFARVPHGALPPLNRR